MDGKYWITGNLKTWNPISNKNNSPQKREIDTYIEPQFQQLLQEAGLLDIPEPTLQACKFIPKQCCSGEIFINDQAFTVCWSCGKVIADAVKQFIFYAPTMDTDCTYYNGGGRHRHNTGVQLPAKKRYYQSKIHFTTHLKRYLNQSTSPDDVPGELVDNVKAIVDVNDRNAYSDVRECLKRWKLGRHYKDIFHIIYRAGGKQPELQADQLQRLDRSINSIQTYFYTKRTNLGKKSMPCVPWLLEQLLIQCGHQPYYYLHTLKAAALQVEAEKFYESYIREVGFIE
jgi:hypothetical protein